MVVLARKYQQPIDRCKTNNIS
jgi:hypothetical protein